VTRTDGEFTVTDGPFTEAKRFQEIAGDGEMWVRQVW